MAGRLNRILWIIPLMWLLSACGASSDTRPLPTLAQLPVTTASAETGFDDDDATPTPETGGNPGNPSQQTPIPPATENAIELQPFSLEGSGIAVDISLAETVRISGEGSLTCNESGAYVIATSVDAIPRLSFILPADTPPDTYPLHDTVIDEIEIRPVLILESGVTYDVQMDGLFILEALPSVEGGALKGDFEYAVSALVDPSQVILVRGGFDFNVPAGFCV